MIYQHIKDSKLQARKAKNTDAVTFWSFLQGELERVAKDPTDEQSLKVLNKVLAGMNENPNSSEWEISVLAGVVNQFTPKQLTDDQIRFELQSVKATGDYTIGSVQKYFKANYPGQYDGGTLTRLFKES